MADAPKKISTSQYYPDFKMTRTFPERAPINPCFLLPGSAQPIQLVEAPSSLVMIVAVPDTGCEHIALAQYHPAKPYGAISIFTPETARATASALIELAEELEANAATLANAAFAKAKGAKP